MKELSDNINAAQKALFNLKRADNRLCLISCINGAIYGEDDQEAALKELIYQAQRKIIILREEANQEYEARYE